jgi:hypothetical protein
MNAPMHRVTSRLDAFGDRARAIVIGEANDLAARRLFQAVIRAAQNEFAISINLDKGEVVEPDSDGHSVPRLSIAMPIL